MRLEPITIQVHPISARVLHSVYGPQPISVDRLDLLFSMLSRGAKGRVKEEQIAELTIPVTLLVNAHLAEKIKRRGAMVGLQLAQFHKDVMCAHTAAAVQHQGEALAAIRDWYQRHGIGEDDYAIETAYKYWQRYLWKMQSFLPSFPVKKVSKKDAKRAVFTGFVKINGKYQRAWSPDEIECATVRVFELAQACLTHTPARLEHQIRAYIYAIRSAQKQVEIARLLKVPNATARLRVQAMRDWLSVDATARAMFEKILATRPEL